MATAAHGFWAQFNVLIISLKIPNGLEWDSLTACPCPIQTCLNTEMFSKVLASYFTSFQMHDCGGLKAGSLRIACLSLSGQNAFIQAFGWR